MQIKKEKKQQDILLLTKLNDYFLAAGFLAAVLAAGLEAAVLAAGFAAVFVAAAFAVEAAGFAADLAGALPAA